MTIHFTDNEKQLLGILIEADGFRSVTQLVNQMGFSKRSVYSFIQSINRKCIQLQIEPPRNVYRQGYSLTEVAKTSLKSILMANIDPVMQFSKLTSNERQMFDLLLLFLGEQVTTTRLMQWEAISKHTVLSDLAQLKQQLKPYHIDVLANQNGHQLLGDELMIRNYMQTTIHERQIILSRFLNKAKSTATFSEITSLNLMINEWIQQVERETKQIYSDDMVLFLENYYSLVLHRMMNNRVLPAGEFLTTPSDLQEMKRSVAYRLADDFIMQFGRELVEKTDEAYYLGSLLLEGQLNTPSQDNIKMEIVETTRAVLANFKQLAGVAFKDEEQLQQELYIHLQSTYYRAKYHHQYADGIVAKIKEDYPDIYTYTKISIYPFEKLSRTRLTENEIALIAIYFGAQVVRESRTSKSALIVCSSGIGTSRFLMAQLNNVFPELKLSGPISKKTYQGLPTVSDDIVISTVPLAKLNQPVLKVDPILDESGLDQLKKQLAVHDVVTTVTNTHQLQSLLDVIADNTEIKNISSLIVGLKEVLTFAIQPKISLERGYQPMLSELIKPDTIRFATTQPDSWEAAIELAALPLLEQHQIEPSYVRAMIDSVKENGPYINIGRGVALAHARPEAGVNKLSMSVLKLKQDIDLVDADHKVSLVFVLAAIDTTAHLKALSELASVLGDKDLLRQLFDAKNEQTFMNIILRSEQK